MKTTLWTLIVCVPLSLFPTGAAFAADAPFNWSGWYGGADLGISYNSYNYDDLDGWSGGDRSVVNAIGFQPGIRGGYNWQINRAVLGIEADYNGDFDAGQVFDEHAALTNTTLTEKGGVTSYGTLRGRAGALVGDDILAYLTAGAVYALDNQRVDSTNSNHVPPSHERWEGATNQFGLVFGLGSEFALTQHISMSGEFLQALFLQDQVHGACIGSCDSNTTSFRYGMEPDMSILRVGVNWHFG